MSIAHPHTDTHAHEHDHEHDHDHGLRQVSAGGKKDILIALTITLLMMVAEAIGGLLSNSLALLSDAGHMLTDNLALLLSFFALTFSSLPATDRKTYGFYRLEILAAFVNGIVLVLISLYIMYHAYLRLVHPQPV
jgi:cobalt-zinc-cadmium efflux system protein